MEAKEDIDEFNSIKKIIVDQLKNARIEMDNLLINIIPIYDNTCYFCILNLKGSKCKNCEYGKTYGKCTNSNSNWHITRNWTEKICINFVNYCGNDLDFYSLTIKKLKEIYDYYIISIDNSKTLNNLMIVKKEFVITMIRRLKIGEKIHKNFEKHNKDVDDFIEFFNKTYWDGEIMKKAEKLKKEIKSTDWLFVHDLKPEIRDGLIKIGYKEHDAIHQVNQKYVSIPSKVSVYNNKEWYDFIAMRTRYNRITLISYDFKNRWSDVDEDVRFLTNSSCEVCVTIDDFQRVIGKDIKFKII